MTLHDQLTAIFDDVDVTGSLTAIDLTTDASVHHDSRTPYALASVLKLPLTWALLTLDHETTLDAATPITLQPGHRTHGPVGIAQLRDPITLSARDSAYYAMALSDNAAADGIWDLIGTPRIRDTLARLELPGLAMRGPIRDMFRLLDAQRARDHLDDTALLAADPATLDALDPRQVTSATTDDLARLLQGIHQRAHAGSPPDQAVIDLLGQQLVRHRLASGFPATDIDVRGKTGTLLALHHEAGLVTYPDGHAYALTVLTSSRTLDIHHRIDTAIGEAARTAVQHLRRSPRPQMTSR